MRGVETGMARTLLEERVVVRVRRYAAAEEDQVCLADIDDLMALPRRYGDSVSSSDAGLLVRDWHGRERVYRLDPACCRALVDRLGKFVAHCCANAKCCRDQGGGQP